MVDFSSAHAQSTSAECFSLKTSFEPLQDGKSPHNFSSNELMRCSHAELLNMQSLITNALQAQRGVASAGPPATETWPSTKTANEQMRACKEAPKKDFDDLMDLF